MEQLYGRDYFEAQKRTIPKPLIRAIDASLPIQSSDIVLEIGVGGGSLISHLKLKSRNVIGIDLNHFAPNTPNVLKADARSLPLREGVFDKVISVHTLEHIDDLPAVLREMDRVMKQGGMAFHLFPAHFFTKAEGAIFDALRMNGLNLVKAWSDAHQLHVHRLSPKKVQEFLIGTNLDMIASRRHMVPENLSVSWGVLLEKV